MTKGAGRDISVEAKNLWSSFSFGFWSDMNQGLIDIDGAFHKLWKKISHDECKNSYINDLFFKLDYFLKMSLLKT